MNTVHEKRMMKARTELVMSQPFFGALALRIEFEPSDKVKTCVTNGYKMRYNPKYVEGLTNAQATGLVAAEVMHVAMLHHLRRGNRDMKKWNKACDHATEHILQEAGFELPTDRPPLPQYKDKCAEEIYTLLPDNPGGGDSGHGGTGGAGGNESGNGGGSGESDTPGNNDNEGNGEVEDSDSVNKGTSSKMEEEADWKIAVANATHVAKQRGKLPASIERMLNDLLEPTLPWKDILRRFMTERANDNFSWLRGNRRFLASGMYLPSRYSTETGEVAVCIDTSGSIGEKELNEFGAEIRSIIEELRPSKTYVIYCDAAVNHVDEFGPDDPLELKPYGGGGTDFRPPFKWLEKHNVLPKCLVYLTDGYGEFPEDADFPVLWAINNHQVTPPMGEHFVLDVN